MSKTFKPNRPTVELRQSRIRRDPPPAPAAKLTVLPDTSERETWTVVLGVFLFALAIMIIIIAASDYTA